MTADAGITKNVSFHTSRHTFAVLTLAAGSDLYTVGKLLGHTSINSTQVYADVVMETKVETISRISNYFSKLNYFKKVRFLEYIKIKINAKKAFITTISVGTNAGLTNK